MTTFLAIAAVLGSPVGVGLGWWLNQLSARRATEREIQREDRRRREEARAVRVAKLAAAAADLMPAARRAATDPRRGLHEFEHAVEGVERVMIEFHLDEDEELSVRASGLMRRAARLLEAIRDYYRDILGPDATGARSPAYRAVLDEAMLDLMGWAFEGHEHAVLGEDASGEEATAGRPRAAHEV